MKQDPLRGLLEANLSELADARTHGKEQRAKSGEQGEEQKAENLKT
jgi:hypothetical protein